MRKPWLDSPVAITDNGQVLLDWPHAYQLVDALIPEIAGTLTSCTTVPVDDGPDLQISLVYFDQAVDCAALYTQSHCASPAIVHSRKATADGRIQAIVVISKNAALFSAKEFEDLDEVIDVFAKELDIHRDLICIACTGVIGVALPKKDVINVVPKLVRNLKPADFNQVAESILTTDKRAKLVSFSHGPYWICGYGKGAGMIEPNMATMLVYLYTNFPLSTNSLNSHLKAACDRTLNSLSVDSDTSTSDTLLLCKLPTTTASLDKEELSSIFVAGLEAALLKMTHKIAAEAEGANKLIEVTVESDFSQSACKALARSVINSPLVKCAINGADPNWGRVVMAIGKTEHDDIKSIGREQLKISIQDEMLYAYGDSRHVDLKRLSTSIKHEDYIRIHVQIGAGNNSATLWGCDLSKEYVHENSMYTT